MLNHLATIDASKLAQPRRWKSINLTLFGLNRFGNENHDDYVYFHLSP